MTLRSVCLRPLLRSAILLSVALAQPLFACEVWISSISHRDKVSPSVDITAHKASCGGTLEIWIDGSHMPGDTTADTRTFTANLSPTSGNPHRVTAQATSGGSVLRQSQILYVTAVDPTTINPDYTSIVSIWNPSGCPESNPSCSWKEKLPSGTFYVDARVYSNSANITKVSLYVDGVHKQSFDNLANLKSYVFHSGAVSFEPGANPHRVTVQALSGSTVIGRLARYVDSVSIPATGFNSDGGTQTDIDESDAGLDYWNHTCSNTALKCVGNTRPAEEHTINRDGLGMKFFADAGTFQEAFWYFLWDQWYAARGLPLPNSNSRVKYVKYEFEARINTSNPQALEFQVEQRRPNEGVRIFAIQDPYHQAGFWRSYDITEQNGGDPDVLSWQPTNVPYLPMTASCWYKFIFEFHVDDDPALPTPLIRHDALWAYPVAGTGCANPYGTVRKPIDQHNAHDIITSTKDELTTAVQLDTNSAGTAYNLYVDKMTVTLTQE